MTARGEVIRLASANPCATLETIAQEVGVTRERVRQIANKEGLLPYRNRRMALRIPSEPCRHCGEPLNRGTTTPLHNRCAVAYNTIQVECSFCHELYSVYSPQWIQEGLRQNRQRAQCPACRQGRALDCSACGETFQPTNDQRSRVRRGHRAYCGRDECRAESHRYTASCGLLGRTAKRYPEWLVGLTRVEVTA